MIDYFRDGTGCLIETFDKISIRTFIRAGRLIETLVYCTGNFFFFQGHDNVRSVSLSYMISFGIL